VTSPRRDVLAAPLGAANPRNGATVAAAKSAGESPGAVSASQSSRPADGGAKRARALGLPATPRRGHVVDLGAVLPGVFGDLALGRWLPEQYLGAAVFVVCVVVAVGWVVWCHRHGRGAWLD